MISWRFGWQLSWQTMRRSTAVLLLMLMLGCTQYAVAHLMVAQKGAVNIVGDGAFVVLSIPASALPNSDDDGDGSLSRAELAKHHRSLASDIKKRLKLIDGKESRALQDMLLSLALAGHAHTDSSSQLIITGQFNLAGLGDKAKLYVDLFGSSQAENMLEIKTIQSSNKQTQLLLFTPQQREHTLFAAE